MYKIQRSKLGFTLIELITVLAIIAIIVGLAYPSLSGYTQMQREKDRAVHEQVINEALMQVLALEGRTPSVIGDIGDVKSHLNSNYMVVFNDAIYNYEIAYGKITVSFK